MRDTTKEFFKENGKTIGEVVLGSAIYSLGMNLFYTPAKLLAGGVAGFAQLLHYEFGWSIALMVVLINIPMFLIGLWLINRKFIDKSSHSDAVYYTDILDALSDDDAPWYLLGTHSNQSDQFDADLIKAVLQHALNTGWTIMTLNEAFHYRERYYRIQEMFGLN